MDIADQAQLEMETEEQLRARINLTPEASAIGRCLDCGEPLEAPKRWCDKFCMDAWQHRQNMKALR